MPKSENHKLKSLLVAQVLLKRTDEEHAVKTSDIIEHLKNHCNKYHKILFSQMGFLFFITQPKPLCFCRVCTNLNLIK